MSYKQQNMIRRNPSTNERWEEKNILIYIMGVDSQIFFLLCYLISFGVNEFPNYMAWKKLVSKT